MTAFGLSAIVAGTAFFLWRRIDSDDRLKIWPRYGLFCGLCCTGSLFGLFSSAAFMSSMVNLFTSNCEQRYWYAAHQVLSAICALCLMVAKLLLLDRMLIFAVPKSDAKSKHLALAGQLALAVVILACAVNLISCIPSATYQVDIGAMLCSGVPFNNTAVKVKLSQVARVESVQSFCESIWLWTVVLAYFVVGILGARRVRSAFPSGMQSLNEIRSQVVGKRLHTQIVVTTASLLVTSVLRCAYATWYALIYGRSNIADCEDTKFICSSCFNDSQLALVYDLYTPELYLALEFLSAPCSILVALWGMTSDRTILLMRTALKQPLLLVVDSDNSKI
jgi:hypothetical protein